MSGLFPESYYTWLNNIQTKIGPASLILIIIAIALIGSFALSRICKLIGIPYITAYIILGILLGPSLLSFIPSHMLVGTSGEETSLLGNSGYAGLSFLSDLTMGFIAFSCGKFFKWDHIKSGGTKVVFVSTLMALIVGAATGAISYLLYAVAFGEVSISLGENTILLKDLGVAPALLIGCCAACVSPTATSSIIRQYKAKGHFTERIFQNILISNIVAILAFSLILGLTSSGALKGFVNERIVSGGEVAYQMFKPLISNIVFTIAAVLFAYILSKLNNYKRTNDSRIILTIAFTTILVAMCSVPYSELSPSAPFSKISPLLPCMAFGIAYLNLSKSESLFIQLDNFLPPILCLFFVISGAKLNLRNFENWQFVIIAVFFIIVRTLSQLGSTNGLGKLFGCSTNTRYYLPLTMFTMTSVAVGLINLAYSVLPNNEPMIPSFVYPVILTACIVLEIIGPIFSKIALVKTSSVDPAYFQIKREAKKNIDRELPNE